MTESGMLKITGRFKELRFSCKVGWPQNRGPGFLVLSTTRNNSGTKHVGVTVWPFNWSLPPCRERLRKPVLTRFVCKVAG